MMAQSRSRTPSILAIACLIFFYYLYHDDKPPNVRMFNRYGLTKTPGTDDVEMVVASTSRDNVTWLNDYLLDWKKNIYVVDDTDAALTVPMNKGREAMVFLT
jgi:hypothetical protein